MKGKKEDEKTSKREGIYEVTEGSLSNNILLWNSWFWVRSGDSENSEDELSEPDNYISNLTDSSGDDESSDEVTDSPSPLYFLNDCEGTGGSVYEDHVVEIAAVLQPLAGNVETNIPSTFQSVINTSKRVGTLG